MSSAVIVNPATGLPLPKKSAAGGAITRAPLGSNMQCVTATASPTVRVPLQPSEGSCFGVEDASANAAAHPITIDGNGQLIDGAATLVLSVSGAFASFVFDRGQWRRLTARRLLQAPPTLEGPAILEMVADQSIAPAPAGTVTAVSGTAPITSSGGATPAIGIAASSALVPGSMSAAQFSKLAAIAISNVTATAPLASSGGATPAISIPAASGATAGSMAAADKTKLDGIQPQGVSLPLAALDLDWSLGGTYSKNLAAGANVLTFSNVVDGELVIFYARSAGGGSTLTQPAGVIWPGGVVPTQTAVGTDVYTYVAIGGSVVGSVIQDVK